MHLFPSHAFGLDISDRSIELLELRTRFGSLAVRAYGRCSLPYGLVERGEVKKPEQLAAVLQRLLKQTKGSGLSTKNVVVTLPESRIFMYVFTLPAAVSERSIGEAVQFKAEETIPLLPEQVYHDYRVIRQSGETQEVYYAACPKGVVDGYRQALELAGLRPVVFEPESWATARALVPDRTSATAIVDIGERVTTVTIFDQKGIRFSRTIPVAGHTLVNAIKKQRTVSATEAEHLLQAEGLLKIPKQSRRREKHLRLEEELEPLYAALTEAMQYYQEQGHDAVQRVVLCGGVSQTPGLAEAFGKRLGVAVALGDPLASIRKRRSLPAAAHPLLYATVAGAARRGLDHRTIEDGINFLEHQHEHHRFTVSRFFHFNRPQPGEHKPSPHRRVLVLAGIFLVLIAVFVVLLLVRQQ